MNTLLISPKSFRAIIETMVGQSFVKSLPPWIHASLNATEQASLPEKLTLLTDSSGRALGVARILPEEVALAGGISADGVETAKLIGLPSGDAEGGSAAVGERCRYYLLRFRGRCIVSKDEATCNLADVIRSASLVTVNDIPQLGTGALMDIVASTDDSRVLKLQVYHYNAASVTDSMSLEFGMSGQNESSLIILNVDAIGYISSAATPDDLKNIMAEAVDRQYKSARAKVASAPIESCGSVGVKHFLVAPGLLISLCSLLSEDKENEDASTSVQRRLAIHRAFMLPEHRPCIRRKCALDLDVSRNPLDIAPVQSDGGWRGRLADVHVGIKGHGLGDKCVTVDLVRGHYLYCHYMQDKVNDSGWGCAYRSLQTILSWCVSEGYTSFPDGVLPSHKEIQQSLVDVGDKPAKFVGSRDWIGANEVCYALETLTGVTSKILHVSKGSEMENRGRELARHFNEQGSPVMVGGGVLAWTILAVARDSRTGKTRFLILDPHFEGQDNISVIQGKGWVGWKSADIFAANAFYNLCMPIRPSSV
jgi:Ufm1-specific protease 2